MISLPTDILALLKIVTGITIFFYLTTIIVRRRSNVKVFTVMPGVFW